MESGLLTKLYLYACNVDEIKTGKISTNI